ncbi:MAG TPA: 3-dehydroquinate synthase II [Methylomirabilota bacterium]|nr:3-dehydroquinate synthase II [Methylomirabilota bacterium]
MKEIWLRVDQRDKTELKEKILHSAEGICSVAVLSSSDLQFAQGLKIRTASADSRSDIKLVQHDEFGSGQILEACAVELIVKNASDEARVLELIDRGARYVIVKCPNWKVIPLENLIARTRNKATLLADVSQINEAKLALEALELGVDGIVLTAKSPDDILEINNFLHQGQNELLLAAARVVSKRSLGSGARVCIDTCELMRPGEGMLVGSQSSGLFLLEAEVHKNPHVEPRPFRVNAGPVSSYVLIPGFKTRYLSEMKAGDEVLIVDRTGKTRQGHVGRIKIERRPMYLVETELGDRPYSLIVQNAETVRLVSGSDSKPVTDLASGDEVLVFVQEGGRHFGTLVADETVIER